MQNKIYKKAIFLCPSKYSIHNSIKSILSEICHEVVGMDVMNYSKNYEININTQMFRLPFSIRNRWISYYQGKINAMFLLDFKKLSPDMVFVYNSEMLLPATVSEIKKTARIVFFLGDSPFFSPTNKYFLTVIGMGDLILVPDSFWLQQLTTIGIKNVRYFLPGIDELSYHQHPLEEDMNNVFETDVLYCGRCYTDSWGYKKTLLMSKFTKFNLEIYGGKHWKKWFIFFPELEKAYHESGFIPTRKLNAMINKTKLMPIDGNPGVLNGFHLRLFEALGAGALPLVEYRKDVEELLFRDSGYMVPLIKDYRDATDLADYYLNHEDERKELVRTLYSFIKKEYSFENNAGLIKEFLN
jgi:hypothetical protein